VLLGNKNFSKIYISDDKTKQQQSYLKQLRDELADRVGKGENNLTIKYVNKTPKIVEKKKLITGKPFTCKIMYTNISSLMAKFNDFSMEIANSKPNIIALTETWLNSDVSNNMIGLNNYKLFRKDRIHGRGGGVCIYVNENLIKSKFQITVLDISVEPYDTLWIKFSSNLFSFVIACVYRPPLNASSNSIENDRKLINVIEDQFKNLSNLIIVGDFNYPNIKWKADCYSSSSFSDSLFTDMLNDNNISQAVSDFTRFRHNQKSSLLDLVLISDCNLISNLSTSDPIGLSDHCTIEIDLQVILYSKCNIESFVYKFTDYASLSKCLDLTDWSILYNSADVEEQWNFFLNTINSLTTKNTKTVVSKRLFMKPWITNELLNKVNLKKKLWNKFKQSKNNNDYNIHRKFSNNLSFEIRNARSKYEAKLLKKPQSFYSYVRKHTSSKVAIPIIRNKDNVLCSNFSETANAYADFFASVYSSDSTVSLPNISSFKYKNLLTDISITK
jgi:exonuclease III